ncbi:MAG: hypothetical protein RR011_02615 [Oscillospiraceae bacterium]
MTPFDVIEIFWLTGVGEGCARAYVRTSADWDVRLGRRRASVAACEIRHF